MREYYSFPDGPEVPIGPILTHLYDLQCAWVASLQDPTPGRKMALKAAMDEQEELVQEQINLREKRRKAVTS